MYHPHIHPVFFGYNGRNITYDAHSVDTGKLHDRRERHYFMSYPFHRYNFVPITGHQPYSLGAFTFMNRHFPSYTHPDNIISRNRATTRGDDDIGIFITDFLLPIIFIFPILAISITPEELQLPILHKSIFSFLFQFLYNLFARHNISRNFRI